MLSVVQAPSFIFKKKQQPNNFLDSYKVLKTMGVFHLTPLDFGLEPWHNEKLCSSSTAKVMSLYYVRICSTSNTWRGYSYPLSQLFIRSPKYFLGREWHLFHWEQVSFNLNRLFLIPFSLTKKGVPKKRSREKESPLNVCFYESGKWKNPYPCKTLIYPGIMCVENTECLKIWLHVHKRKILDVQ